MPIQFPDPVQPISNIRALINEYPFIKVNGVGKSILGKEIPAIVLGTGDRKFLYVGAHHGMEWITSAVLLKFINEFCKMYQANGKIDNWQLQTLWRHFSIHIVPMLNPDGVDYQLNGIKQENPLYERVIAMNRGSNDFTHWQANARGVDLNHNYNAGFAEYKKLEQAEHIPCGAPTRYSGIYPESEPEVYALCNYFRFFAPWKGVFTFHTQGEELFWKSRGKFIASSQAAIRKIALESGYLLNEAEGLAAFGGLTDWCIEECNTPAVTFECGKGKNPLPASDLFSIYAKIRKVLFLAPTYF